MRAQVLSFLILFFAFQMSFAGGPSEGGISGGGGSVIDPHIPCETQDPQQVASLILQTRPLFRRYLLYKFDQLQKNQLTAEEKRLFDKMTNSDPAGFVNQLEHYNVQVDDKSPCFTSDRRPVDGSIFSSQPNSFCISASSIAQKVHMSEVVPQSAALMVHEFSEVRGLDEDEAVEMQKTAIKDLQ
ncbi:MAG: hypothetical protein ACXVAX_09415 [Pseudobdellovibrio sp.]